MQTIKATKNVWLLATDGITFIPIALSKGEELSTALPTFEEYLSRESFLIRLEELSIEYDENDFILPELELKPDWDIFNLQIFSNVRFNQVYGRALQQAPVVAGSLSVAVDQITTKGLALFSMIYPLICQLGGATVEDKLVWRQLARDNNLPQEFIDIL